MLDIVCQARWKAVLGRRVTRVCVKVVVAMVGDVLWVLFCEFGYIWQKW